MKARELSPCLVHHSPSITYHSPLFMLAEAFDEGAAHEVVGGVEVGPVEDDASDDEDGRRRAADAEHDLAEVRRRGIEEGHPAGREIAGTNAREFILARK